MWLDIVLFSEFGSLAVRKKLFLNRRGQVNLREYSYTIVTHLSDTRVI